MTNEDTKNQIVIKKFIIKNVCELLTEALDMSDSWDIAETRIHEALEALQSLQGSEIQLAVPEDLLVYIDALEALNPGSTFGTDGNYIDKTQDTMKLIIRPKTE